MGNLINKFGWIALITFGVILISCNGDEDEDHGTPAPVENLNPGPCDSSFALDETEAVNFAKAMGICKVSSGSSDWGLVTAQFVRANGASVPVSLQYGLMQNFGNNNTARDGHNLVVMSTGRARTPSQPQACGSSACFEGGAGTSSTGIPAEVPGCPLVNNIYDDAGILLTLKVPPTATGFAIDHSFFTFDYPEYVCSSYNDQFLIIMDPAPAGAVNGNVALDSVSNPIGVNSVLLQGTNSSLLPGTGYGLWNDGASTGWLQTTVPVTGGSTITIKLLIFDAGDSNSDSSVLIDNFIWLEGSVTLGTKRI